MTAALTTEPPHDLDLERNVLAAVFDNPETFDELRTILPGQNAFYGHLHRVIFGILSDLSAAGKPLDLPAVSTIIHDRGWQDELGPEGWGVLTEFCGAGISAAAVPYHAQQLRKLYVARSLLALGSQMAGDVLRRRMDPDDLRAEFERQLFSLGESAVALKPKNSASVMNAVLDRLDAYSRRERVGLETGFIDIDNALGGMRPSELVILAGRPGQGKSMLAVNIATHLSTLDPPVPVYLFNLEMSNEEVAERVVCAESGVDHFALRTGRLGKEQEEKALRAAMTLRSMPVLWQDRPSMKPSELLSCLRREKRKQGVKLAIVDHLLLMGNDQQHRTQNDRVGEVSRMLKLAAKEVGIPILALCQMNRGIDGRSDEMPRLSDLRDSGNIEQDADTVMFLHRQSSEQEENVSTLFIAKQRNGPTAMIRLVANKKSFRFHNYAGV